MPQRRRPALLTADYTRADRAPQKNLCVL